MSGTGRRWGFLLGASCVTVLAVWAVVELPHFGAGTHPYRTAALRAAVEHRTANLVSSVNFDLRGLDTFGEESILFASVLAVVVLLRPGEDETARAPLAGGRVLDATRLMAWVMLPVTVVIGLDVIAHGHLTPGGGFQGGVVLGTAIHLTYVGGTYRALERARPLRGAEWGEALGAGAFACVGIAGLLVAGSFLTNVIPGGTLGELFSAGTVPLLNGAVGVEVASGVVLLLAKFLEQAVAVRSEEAG